ncbi:MAG: glycosyltransferase [Candidatus Bathyarchaeia archaeon]
MTALANMMYLLSVASVIVYKFYTVRHITDGDFFTFYGVAVTAYILSRFALAESYRHEQPRIEYLPKVTVVIPAYNEERHIGKTLLHHVRSDYPKDRLEIIVVNDGSRDRTEQEVKRIMKENPDTAIKLINHTVNLGKRHALATGIRQAEGEVIVTNDSDSFVHPDAVRRIVQPLQQGLIGGVTGHADVHNWRENLLTKVQYVRYFVAFRVYKSAETLYDSVVCLSGCLAAYRKPVLMRFLDEWENQRFWGQRCTYGDDRGITTFILRSGLKAVYEPTARTETIVPTTLRQFWRQQLRWKKSWIRETYLAGKFMWRKHPMMAVGFYSNAFLTVFSFFIVIRVFFLLPALQSTLPIFYIIGLALVSLVYLAYCNKHGIYQGWIFPVVWSVMYALILVWQIPLAFLTLRDGRWGTR